MFWNRKDTSHIGIPVNYPRVRIKVYGKEIDGYIEEDALYYLDDHRKVFKVRSESTDPITEETVGAVIGMSIKMAEKDEGYIKIEHNRKILYETTHNLLEIKLKDTESVPEVYYKGERLDSMSRGLVDLSYHYHTTGDSSEVPDGANDIHIEYFNGDDGEHLDMRTIGHTRV